MKERARWPRWGWFIFGLLLCGVAEILHLLRAEPFDPTNLALGVMLATLATVGGPLLEQGHRLWPVVWLIGGLVAIGTMAFLPDWAILSAAIVFAAARYGWWETINGFFDRRSQRRPAIS